jgi:hypothetical protein
LAKGYVCGYFWPLLKFLAECLNLFLEIISVSGQFWFCFKSPERVQDIWNAKDEVKQGVEWMLNFLDISIKELFPIRGVQKAGSLI